MMTCPAFSEYLQTLIPCNIEASNYIL